MMFVYDFRIVALLACAIFYLRAAQGEEGSYQMGTGLFWAGLSVLIFLTTWLVLAWGLVGCLVGQVGLYVAITCVRMLRK